MTLLPSPFLPPAPPKDPAVNPLKNIIPAKYRQVVYAVVALASAIVAIPDLVPGPIAAKVTAAIASLSSLLAAGNVSTKP